MNIETLIAPTDLRDYAKLAFNCNELPLDVEHSEA